MIAVVAAFNQEKGLVGAFSVITNLRVDLRLKLYCGDGVMVGPGVTTYLAVLLVWLLGR